MGSWTLGLLAGALGAAFLFSRLFRLPLWWLKRRELKLIYASALGLLFSIVVGGYGFADGGSPLFGKAAIVYAPAFALMLMIDMTIHFAKKRKLASNGQVTL